MKINLFGMFQDEIMEQITQYGLAKYRARQIVEWMYQKGARSFAEMKNLPGNDQRTLEKHFVVDSVIVKADQHSSDGKTSKTLLSFGDGAKVETVLMRQRYGNSVCVSSQVGCGMGCVFCASTLHGVERNLSGGEMLSQVVHFGNLLRIDQQTVNSVVIMGSGEPLINYDNVIKFIRLCHEAYTFNMSYRHFTISTAGFVPGIIRLASEGLPITLAISLHAPNNGLRSQLMPINQQYSIEEVLAAGDIYFEKTGRRVTYEYILIADKNDSVKQAVELVTLLAGRSINVSLIPINSVPERGLFRSKPETVQRFAQYLQSQKVNVTVRKEMGTDISAACGQLRNQIQSDDN